MNDCIFCKIVAGEIPSQKVYEDDYVYAFKDIQPQAKVHVLIIPKVHISSVNELEDSHKELIGHIFISAGKIAEMLGVKESGYRIVNNCGKDGGQTVNHIHFHMFGGEPFGWPPF